MTLVVAWNGEEETKQKESAQTETTTEAEPATMAVTEETMVVEKTMEEPLPKSGGPEIASVLLPAAALLVGSGILAYAVLRRR